MQALAVNNVSGLKSGNSFAPYPNTQASLDATTTDITNKQKGNTKTGLNGDSTLEQFVNTWINGIGKGRNPNQGYTADDVAKDLGVTPTTKFGSIDPQKLALSVAKHETGYNSSSATPNNISTDMQDYNTFAETIKQKYPAYKSADNLTLAKAIIQKYPQYASKVSLPNQATTKIQQTDTSGYIVNPSLPDNEKLTTPPDQSFKGQAKSVAGTIGNALIIGEKGVGESLASGLIPHLKAFKEAQTSTDQAEAYIPKLLQAIRANKAKGKDTTRLENALKIAAGGQDISSQYDELNPASKKSTAQALAEVAKVGADILSAGSYGQLRGATAIQNSGKLIGTPGTIGNLISKDTLPSLAVKGAQYVGKKAGEATLGGVTTKIGKGLLYYLLANALTGNKGLGGVKDAVLKGIIP